MSPKELLAEAARLAIESVQKGWGGPFGAVIADKGGSIFARGQNKVLLTGDPTAHAEMEAIRAASLAIHTGGMTKSRDQNVGLDGISATGVDPQLYQAGQRASMLEGLILYSTGEPCPMCLAASYWARLDACYFAMDISQTREIGFDDEFIYREFGRPIGERDLKTVQIRSPESEQAFDLWMTKSNRLLY
jgi:guanine deaminase